MRPLLRTRVFGLHGFPEAANRSGVRPNVGWRFVVLDMFTCAGDDCILQALAAGFPSGGLSSDLCVRHIDGVPYATEITQAPCRESIVRKIRQPPDLRLRHETRIGFAPTVDKTVPGVI